MKNIDSSDNEKPEHENKSFTNQEKVSQVHEELNECKQQILRLRADMENQRKRLEREIENAKAFAIQNFILKLLPAKDSMEKGLELSTTGNVVDSETLRDGMKATLKLYNEAFKSAGLEEIDPIGQAFNPEFHEAMAIKNVNDTEPNRVLKVFQKGCMLNGRLVRPARVEVSSNL